MEQRVNQPSTSQNNTSVNIKPNNTVASPYNSGARKSTMVSQPKITSQRALDLFSEALELSKNEIKGQNMDTISPLAFTKVIMKH